MNKTTTCSMAVLFLRILAAIDTARSLMNGCARDAEPGDPAIVGLVIAADLLDSAHAAMAAALAGLP